MAKGVSGIAMESSKERKSGWKPVREWGMTAAAVAEIALRIEIMENKELCLLLSPCMITRSVKGSL